MLQLMNHNVDSFFLFGFVLPEESPESRLFLFFLSSGLSLGLIPAPALTFTCSSSESFTKAFNLHRV